jgi:hypothetical protein
MSIAIFAAGAFLGLFLGIFITAVMTMSSCCDSGGDLDE